MKRSQNLAYVLADYERHGTPAQIHLVWSNGTKAGIGNAQAISAAMAAIKGELEKQYQTALANGD